MNGMREAAPTQRERPPRIPRVVLTIAAALLVAGLYLLMANNRFYFLEGSAAGDILLAKALAGGEGFREVWRLGQPPCTVRPPGLALIMAGVVKVFYLKLLVIKLVNNCFGVVACVFAFLLLRRRMDSFYLALVFALVSLTLPFLIQISLYIYSGLAYTAFALAALVVFERADDDGFRSSRHLAAFTVISSAGAMIRTMEIALPLAAVLSLLTRNNSLSPRKRLIWTAAIVIAALAGPGAWTLRNYLAKDVLDRPYFSKLLVGEPPGSSYWLAEDQGVPLLPNPRPLTTESFLRRLQNNTDYYLESIAGMIAPPTEGAPR